MQVFRLFSRSALSAGILSGGVATDAVTHISANLHVAVTPVENFVLANTYTGQQLMVNTSGIAPTTGTNTQTGVLNRNAGNTWSTLQATVSSGTIPGLLLTSQYGDYVTLVPPPATALVEINLVGNLQPGMGFHAGDKADGTNILKSGQARNGARVSVAIDTAAPQVYDTAGQSLKVSVYLDGLSQHAITIKHTGLYDATLPVLGKPVASFTSSFYGKVNPTISILQGTVAAASTITALWTLTATGSTTYTMTKTLPGGSPVTVGTTFNTGTTYDATGTVPGVALLVNGPLTTGHTATFTTDASMAVVDSVALYTTTGSAAGQYTTPILDATDPATQWFLYEHVDALFANGASTVSISAAVGQSITNHTIGSYTPPPGQPIPPTYVNKNYIINANPDATTNGGANTYSVINLPTTQALTLNGVVLATSGDHYIDAGLMALPQARYAQFTIQLSVNTQGMEAWIRDLMVYNWVPTASGNPLLVGKLGLPPNWVPGPLMQAYYGSLLTFVADYFASVADFVQSYSVGDAVDQYLLAQGASFNEPHILGESSTSYRTRLASSLQAKTLADAPTGIVTSGTGTVGTPLVVPGTGNITVSPVAGEQGTVYFICQQEALLINGVSPTVTATIDSATGFATAVGGGVTVKQLAGRGISITLPDPPYPGLQDLAYGTTSGVDNPAKVLIKQFTQSLIPAGTLFNVNSSTYLNFGPLG